MKSLRSQASQLKELLAEMMIENRLFKKVCWRMGGGLDALEDQAHRPSRV